MPSESSVSRKIASCLCNHRAVYRIDLEKSFCECSETLFNARLVCHSIVSTECEACSFVGIISYENVYIIEFSGLIKSVLVVRNNVSVDDRPCSSSHRKRTSQLRSRHSSELCKRLSSNAFHKLDSIFLSHFETCHVLAWI